MGAAKCNLGGVDRLRGWLRSAMERSIESYAKVSDSFFECFPLDPLLNSVKLSESRVCHVSRAFRSILIENRRFCRKWKHWLPRLRETTVESWATKRQGRRRAMVDYTDKRLIASMHGPLSSCKLSRARKGRAVKGIKEYLPCPRDTPAPLGKIRFTRMRPAKINTRIPLSSAIRFRSGRVNRGKFLDFSAKSVATRIGATRTSKLYRRRGGVSRSRLSA